MLTVVMLATLAQTDLRVAHRKVMTRDGVSLALTRYSPPGHDGRVPVLLLVDLPFARSAAAPLAKALADAGRVVFVAEVRGQGASEAGVTLRGVVAFDFPAIAGAIGGPVDLVAHGWLGSLALAAAGHELKVRRVVALNAPARFEVPNELAEALLSSGRLGALGLSPLGGEHFSALFLLGSAIDPFVLATVKAQLRDLSAATAREWLAWMRTGDLPLDDGSSVRARLQRYEQPTLVVLALGDGFAGPELCATLRERPGVSLHTFSRFDAGDDFSHLTELVGLNAARLIFPRVVRFLE
jgi:predicted alpha/beta hydrolase